MPTRRKVLYTTAILMMFGVLLELSTRVYTYATGRGFLDNPRDFPSPFFTTQHDPEPVIAGQDLVFRCRKVKRVKEKEEIRIVFFGGSTTVNGRAKISYPEILEDRLNATGESRRIVCLNAATDGYSSAHTLVNLALRGLEADPDIISVYENINDLSVNYFGDEVLPDYGNKYKSDFCLGYRHRTGLLNEFMKVSRFARFVGWQFMAIRAPEYEQHYNRAMPGDAEKRGYHEGMQLFERNLRSIVGIARVHGIKAVLATQPASSELRSYEGWQAYNEAIKRIAEQQQCELVDVAAAVVADDLFFDQVHNTRAGVTAVADVFEETLATLVEDVEIERTAGSRAK